MLWQYTGIDDNCDKNYARGDDTQTTAGIKLRVVEFVSEFFGFCKKRLGV